MTKKKLKVDGVDITINKSGYVSLTDISKRNSDRKAKELIQSWLRNQNTLQFLDTQEQVHNDNFKGGQMAAFRLAASENRNLINPKRYIKETGAIGLISTAGRYGGTFAHTDIALNFCY